MNGFDFKLYNPIILSFSTFLCIVPNMNPLCRICTRFHTSNQRSNGVIKVESRYVLRDPCIYKFTIVALAWRIVIYLLVIAVTLFPCLLFESSALMCQQSGQGWAQIGSDYPRMRQNLDFLRLDR